MNVSILGRNSYSPLTLPDFDYLVDRYSMAAIGGPKLARMKIYGADLDLWQLATKIRCPIEIYTDAGDVAWWGTIAGIEVTALNVIAGASNRVRFGVNISSMANRLAVAYIKVNTENGYEERDTTAWADNALSQNEYGIKELLWTASAATQTHAEAARDTKLEELKYPVATLFPSMYGEDKSVAEIVARGWWDTMGWQYYTNTGTDAVDTATQIATILADKGQFFETVFQDVDSGISILETRDGDATALYEILQMMELGTTNYRRILANVDQHRNVRIYEEPAHSPSTTYLIQSNGDLYSPYNEKLRVDKPTAGVWARWKDAISPSIDTSLLADPSLIFVEEAEYVVADRRVNYTPRGYLDPWMFPVVKEG